MLAYWDSDLLCRFANKAYVTWFGVAPDALIGTSIRDLLGPELFALNEPHIRRALAGQEQTFERVVPGPDGVRRKSLAHYLPDISNGVVHGFFVEVNDVTQLRDTEAALRQEQDLRAQLQHHADRMTALVTERTDMLNVLAHEVRQPLHNAHAALQSAAQAIREGDRAPGVVLDRIQRAQSVLLEITAGLDNTLADAVLLSQAEPITRQDLDIDTMLDLAVSDIDPERRSRIVRVRATETRTASMNSGLMRLALRNLLSNALAYSPEGSPVELRVAEYDNPLALAIDVSDAGPGIPLDLLPRLFSRGARGNDVCNPLGHGLGLYIVRRVLEMHGGQVHLARNGKTGATFRLLIPQEFGD